MSNYSSTISQLVNISIYKMFGWTSIGLFLTSSIAYLLSHSIYFFKFFNPITNSITPLFLGCIVAQFAIILCLNFFINKLSFPSLLGMFFAFTSLNGVNLSLIFLLYEISSIIGVFFIASGISAFMCIYGLITEKDLSPMGYAARMVLWGIILIGFFNIFFKSEALSIFSSFISVLVFSALMAFDIQNMKKYLSELAYNSSIRDKLSIIGSFKIYLNFINLFLSLLELFGKRKKN